MQCIIALSQCALHLTSRHKSFTLLLVSVCVCVCLSVGVCMCMCVNKVSLPCIKHYIYNKIFHWPSESSLLSLPRIPRFKFYLGRSHLALLLTTENEG